MPTNENGSEGDSPCSPNYTVSSTIRNSEVRTVMLYGVPIIALIMDGVERLCLAQISNTLLKNFSYNEIHNRRVALGITCIQCTPVQLELLRRAGAMPVSSRRCGMITKREAERLCKSFLAETKPPKLPENFAFDVYHHCAWGCKGNFMPSRYNSSRAKCIKCTYCGIFFSPNKFIFHSHRLPDSKYVQPDAANFNSWRRHIKLTGNPPEDICLVWEDVKAMFNGGSRKRSMSCGIASSSHHSSFSSSSASPSVSLSVTSSSSSSAGSATASSGSSVNGALRGSTGFVSSSSSSGQHHSHHNHHHHHQSFETKKPRLESPPRSYENTPTPPHSSLIDTNLVKGLPGLGSNCLALPHHSLPGKAYPLPGSGNLFNGSSISGSGGSNVGLNSSLTSSTTGPTAPKTLNGVGTGLPPDFRFADLMWTTSAAAGKHSGAASWSLPYGCVFWPRSPATAAIAAAAAAAAANSAAASGSSCPRDLFHTFDPTAAATVAAATVSGAKGPPALPESSSHPHHWLMPLESSSFLLTSATAAANNRNLIDTVSPFPNGHSSSHVSAFKPINRFTAASSSSSFKFTPSSSSSGASVSSSSVSGLLSESTNQQELSITESPGPGSPSEPEPDIDVIGNDEESKEEIFKSNLEESNNNNEKKDKFLWKQEVGKKSPPFPVISRMDKEIERIESLPDDIRSKSQGLISNSALDLSSIGSLSKGGDDLNRLMINGAESRSRLEKELELMQNLVLTHPYKCGSSSSSSSAASVTPAASSSSSASFPVAPGEPFEDPLRSGDHMSISRDEMHKRLQFVSLLKLNQLNYYTS